MANVTFNAAVQVDAAVGGTLRVTRRVNSSPEGRRTAGRRPTTPVQVHAVEVRTVADVADVPNGGNFLMSVAYLAADDATLHANGAAAGWIGTKVTGYYAFRPPEDSEVVWRVGGADPQLPGMYRWSGDAWLPYRPAAERSMQGQYAIEVLDPEGYVRYLSRLVGGVASQLSRDVAVIPTLLDVNRTPDRLLPRLASQFGFRLQSPLPEVQRRRLRGATARSRDKGLDALSTATLRDLGYVGRVMEVWVNPVHADNWTALADAPSGVAAALAAAGIVPDDNSGEKGQDWIPKFHGATAAALTTYWPSSRVGVHLRRIDGSMIDLNMSANTVASLQEQVSRELMSLALPACVDIRYFAADIPVGSDAAGLSDETDYDDTLPGVPYRLRGSVVAYARLGGRMVPILRVTGTVLYVMAEAGSVRASQLLGGTINAEAAMSGRWSYMIDGTVGVVVYMTGHETISGGFPTVYVLPGTITYAAAMSHAMPQAQLLGGKVRVEGVPGGSMPQAQLLGGTLTAYASMAGPMPAATLLGGTINAEAAMSGDMPVTTP